MLKLTLDLLRFGGDVKRKVTVACKGRDARSDRIESDRVNSSGDLQR
jgi:hypothetical protein